MTIEPIRITGLKEFNKQLKAVDSDLPKAVRVALNQVAEIVVDDARPKVPTGSGRSGRAGRARKSLKVASTRTKVRVRAGGKKAPHYPWLDFGGKVGRRRSVSRPFKREGRYIYRSYFKFKRAGRLQEKAADVLTDVARRAGLEVD